LAASLLCILIPHNESFFETLACVSNLPCLPARLLSAGGRFFFAPHLRRYENFYHEAQWAFSFLIVIPVGNKRERNLGLCL